MIKTILVGYPGSQVIRKLAEYLNRKYLPEFDITYTSHDGKIEDWSKSLADHLAGLSEDIICVALDDYLVSGPVNQAKLTESLALMKDPDVVCIKLCSNSEDEFIEYPITTQYCLWKRDYLLSLLEQTTTPWDFEINGSKIHKVTKDKKVLLETCVPYFTNSSLSARWSGVNLTGLNDEDKLKAKELI